VSKLNKTNPGQDDVSHAPESGEPAESGRNRGQVILPKGAPDDADVRDASADGTGEEFESGRQDAAPRSGA